MFSVIRFVVCIASVSKGNSFILVLDYTKLLYIDVPGMASTSW